MLVTKLSKEDAAEWLDDALSSPALPQSYDRHSEVSRYAGGLTYVDAELFEIDCEELERALDELMGVAPKVVTTAKVNNRHPDQREAAKAVLRTLPADILRGKRSALLAEVNQRLETPISKDTLTRALAEI